MANEITNFIQFDSEDLDTASGKGRISTLTDDIDIEVMPALPSCLNRALSSFRLCLSSGHFGRVVTP